MAGLGPRGNEMAEVVEGMSARWTKADTSLVGDVKAYLIGWEMSWGKEGLDV